MSWNAIWNSRIRKKITSHERKINKLIRSCADATLRCEEHCKENNIIRGSESLKNALFAAEDTAIEFSLFEVTHLAMVSSSWNIV